MPKTLWDLLEEAKATVPEVDCAEALRLLDAEGWQVLDVREPDEFQSGCIAGAINIPRGYLEIMAEPNHPKRSEHLMDRDKKWLIVCSGGRRSLLAGKTLQQIGFENVASLAPGMTGWVQEGQEVEA